MPTAIPSELPSRWVPAGRAGVRQGEEHDGTLKRNKSGGYQKFQKLEVCGFRGALIFRGPAFSRVSMGGACTGRGRTPGRGGSNKAVASAVVRLHRPVRG